MQGLRKYNKVDYLQALSYDFSRLCTRIVQDNVSSNLLKKYGFITGKMIRVTDDVILVRLFGKKTDVITFRFERNDNDMVNFSFDLNLSRTNCELLEELITSVEAIKNEVTENYGLKY